MKQRIWSGNNLVTEFGKESPETEMPGESWEVSGISGDESVIVNGFLKGNNLAELTEIYMGDLTGEKVYEKYGNEFPLLVKLLDAGSDLSVQVHPDDKLAGKRYSAYGKTELWYILKAAPGAKIGYGFREGTGKEEYQNAIATGTLPQILNFEEVNEGDYFFIPAGLVHTIGAGIVLAEIQQPSDVTYRLFDWNRTNDKNGARELHTELAEEAINFNLKGRKGSVPEVGECIHNLADSEHFVTNFVRFTKTMRRDLITPDSFVIILCTTGEFSIDTPQGSFKLGRGESLLIPATIVEATFIPSTGSPSFLESWIKC